jgi:hypothetical protein
MEIVRSASFLADQLGLLKAQKAAIATQISDLEKELARNYRPGSYEGAYFRATLSRFERRSTDWRAIAEKFTISPQLLSAHSAYAEVTQIRVVARIGLEAAA